MFVEPGLVDGRLGTESRGFSALAPRPRKPGNQTEKKR
jgi:hypothetical protein